jgi:hypothetical protein
MGQKALLIFGGALLGDTFHMIPMFNRLCDMGYDDITWITGTYERIVVEFLKYFYPISKIYYIDDGHPSDLNSRKAFLEKASNTYQHLLSDPSFDKIFSDIKQSFEIVGINSDDWSWGKGFTMEETYIRDPYSVLKAEILIPQIVIQGTTIHTFKKFDTIKEVEFPLLTVTIGGPNDYLFPNSRDMRGKPFLEVAQEMVKSKLFVGVHSSCTCLAFYLGMKSVICHPGDCYFRFDRYHKNMKELIVPSKEQIEETIKEQLKGI